ncbi:MAG: hypothetical protein K8F92_09145 [Hyphomicrobium sp.]|nr:MAG: hypothetical protein F9K20_12180 [Hyphomicrobium sp.]MBZ0209804.1 hypothetical protein [Hyphomicrobium sp.]MCZ7595314.1 hypothetical protein [Hyphomicrobium sp.]
MNPADIGGMIGVMMLLWAYFLLQSQQVKFDDYAFLGLNATGSCLIVISLLREFNISAFLIEVAWVAVSLYGIYRRWRRNEE